MMDIAMPRPRGAKKVRVCVSISPQARALLEELARVRKRSMSDVVEELLIEADLGLEDYFRKQGAFQGFVGAAFSIAVAAKILGPESTALIQERASETARRLYGRSPRRSFDVDHPGELDDPRLEALIEAFGVANI